MDEAGREQPFAALVRELGGAVAPEEGGRFVAELRVGTDIWPPVARMGTDSYLLTSGRVGGYEDEQGSREIPAELVARVLDAALAGRVKWERDPDFGWELPMAFPGLDDDERLTLVPRFLYAKTDRVYEYAAKVPECQRLSP